MVAIHLQFNKVKKITLALYTHLETKRKQTHKNEMQKKKKKTLNLPVGQIAITGLMFELCEKNIDKN